MTSTASTILSSYKCENTKAFGIFVLGMHRSGTSTITHGLQLLGADLGPRLLPPAPDNPEGFFESVDVVAINDDLLHELGHDWNDFRALPANWLTSSAAQRAQKRIKLLYAEVYAPARFWAIKDPRLCLTFSLWCDAFRTQDAAFGALLVVRDPDAVARSLQQRNAIDIVFGRALWVRYNQEMVHAVQVVPHRVLPMAAFNSAPDRLVQAVDELSSGRVDMAGLGTDRIELIRALAREGASERPADHVSDAGMLRALVADVAAGVDIAALADASVAQSIEERLHMQRELHELLQAHQALQNEYASCATRIRSLDEQGAKTHELLEQARVKLAEQGALIQTLREENVRQCVEHKRFTAEAADRIESLESDLIKAQTRGEGWQTKYNEVLLSVDSLEARLKTALNDCALNFIAAQTLEKRETELNNKYDLIVKSHSWRVTRPLRFARRTITALLKGDIGPILNEIKFNHVFGPRITRIRSGIRQRILRTAYSKQNIPALNDLLESRSLLSTPEVDALPGAGDAIGFDLSIVTFNSSKWIDKYFNSLIDEGYPLKNIHVWIMDNGSTDDSLGLLRNVSQSLGGRFATFNVAAGRNRGFGAGHHENFKRAKTDFVLVSNIDMEFVRGSLFKLTAHVKDDAAARFAAWEMAQAPYEHPKHYDPVSWVTNWQAYACVMIRKAAYQQVNGFDRRIFMYCEDVELSYRFRSFGWLLKYCPDCVVIHYSYESDGRLFKPLQFYHSVLGSGYVRMRYGTVRDRVAGLLQHIWLVFRLEQPLPKSRLVHVKNCLKLILNTPHFLVGKGEYKANYPFRGFDFEITRFGADHPVLPRPSSRAMISIITRTHAVPHRDELLRQAGISVGKQRHKNIEWIVVQDGGSDLVSTVNEIADAFPHLQVKFIANSKLGRSCAGNAGLAAASGDYFMFLDDDDLIYADHCDVLSNHLDNDENLMAVYALAFEVPSLIGPGSINELDYITHRGHIQEWDYSVLLKYNFIPIQAIMFRRRLYDERGGFNVALDQLEDWNLWLRYGYENIFKLVQKTTSLYRVPAEQGKMADRQRQLDDAYAVAKDDAEKWVESQFNSSDH